MAKNKGRKNVKRMALGGAVRGYAGTSGDGADSEVDAHPYTGQAFDPYTTANPDNAPGKTVTAAQFSQMSNPNTAYQNINQGNPAGIQNRVPGTPAVTQQPYRDEGAINRPKTAATGYTGDTGSTFNGSTFNGKPLAAINSNPNVTMSSIDNSGALNAAARLPATNEAGGPSYAVYGSPGGSGDFAPQGGPGQFASSRLRADLARTGMEQGGANWRTGATEQGATQRIGMSEQGATQRTAMTGGFEAPLRSAQAGYYGQEAALEAPKAQQEQAHANAFLGYQKALANEKDPAKQALLNQKWQDYMKSTAPPAAMETAQAAEERAKATGLGQDVNAWLMQAPPEVQAKYGMKKGGIVRGFAAGGDVPGSSMMPSGGAIQPGVAAGASPIHPAIAQYGQYLTAAAQAKVPPVPFSQYINLLGSTHAAMQGQPTQFPGGMSAGIAPNGMAGGGPVMPSAEGDYDYPGGMRNGGGVGIGGGNAGDGSTGMFGSPATLHDGGNVSALQRPLHGPGTGTSDSIPAVIDGNKPAALSKGEFVIPAHVVHRLGTKFFEELISKNHPSAVAREKREQAYAAR